MNANNDAYIRDVAGARTVLGSIFPDGSTIPAGSSAEVVEADVTTDGHRLVFMSHLPNGQGGVYRRDLVLGTTQPLFDAPVPPFIASAHASGDGNHVLLSLRCPTITPDCAVYPVVEDFGDPLSFGIPFCGNAAYVDQSDDGRYVLINRSATCTGRPGLFDRELGTWRDVSVPTPTSDGATAVAMSGKGRVVLLTAPDTVIPGGVVGNTGLFAVDLGTGWVGRVGADRFGAAMNPGETATDRYALAGNGRTVAFSSLATNLVAGGAGVHDVYARAVLSPSIAAVAPATVTRGTGLTTVTVTGTELLADSVVGVSGAGVSVLSTTLTSEGTTLKVVLSVSAQAALGPRDVTVLLPAGFGGSVAVCAGCLTVT